MRELPTFGVRKVERERTIEQFLTKEVEKLGGRAIKLKFVGLAGAPDRMVVLSGMYGGRVGFIELKNPNNRGKLSQQQAFWRKLFTEMGVLAVVTNTEAGVTAFLDQLWGTP